MVNKRLRGGGWYVIAGNCRAASCFRNSPTDRGLINGFRVVKEVEPRVRSLRGGNWSSRSRFLSSSYRIVIDPAFEFDNDGFRVVKEATNGQ